MYVQSNNNNNKNWFGEYKNEVEVKLWMTVAQAIVLPWLTVTQEQRELKLYLGGDKGINLI